MKDLIEKLDSLPPELDELLEKILGQLDPKNRRESSELFQFVRSNPDKSTLIGLYWSQLTLREALESEIRAMPEDVARYHAEVMQRNVLSRCKCLLNAEGRIRSTTPVTWLHRTAREYLERVDVWTMIKNQSPHYDPEKALGLSLLRQAKAGITSHSDRLLCEALLQFKTLHLLEDQIAFLDEIEKTGMTTCGITPTSDNSHTIYWLWASDVPGFYSDHSTLDGYTTVFHVAIVLDWDWYVQHRLVLDPSLLHKDVANHMALDALMLAVAKDLWDMQYLCLQRGSDPKKLCQTHFLKLGIGKTAWQVMLEGVGDQLQGVHSTVPWAKVVRNSAAFLKHGADPYAELEGYQMKAVIADILKHAKGAASDEDVKYIKEACLQRHKGFLLWRR